MNHVELDFSEAPSSYQQAHRWSAVSIVSCLMISFACLTLILMSWTLSDAVTLDVVGALSGPAWAMGLCGVTSLINAYATYQLTLFLKN